MTWLQCAALAAATLCTYVPALELQWIWDDDQYVTSNTLLQSVDGLWRIWSDPSATPQYYPVVFSTLWGIYQCCGLEPVAFHTVNVLLHAINAVLCFQILKRLQLPAAWWIAMAFALHPLQVESVAWVTELKNVLSTFWMGLAWMTLWPLVHMPCDDPSLSGARKEWSAWRATVQYALGCLWFALALLSKSVTATMPAAMLLSLWYLQGNLRRRQLTLLVPLLLVGGLAGWNTARLEQWHVGAFGTDWDYGALDRVGIAARCIWHYTLSTIAPWQQMFFYPRFDPSIAQASSLLAVLACAIVAVIVSIFAWRGTRGPFACAAMFVGVALPALGFLNVYPHRFSFVADHFVYLPVIGILCFWWSGIDCLQRHWASRLPDTGRWLASMPGVFMLCWYAFLATCHLPAFASATSLWQDTLRKNPNCAVAMQNLALEYLKSDQLAEAEQTILPALELEFDRFQSFNTLGLILGQQGRIEEARRAFERSIELNARNANPWINLASLEHRQTGPSGASQRSARIIEYYQRAWNIEPQYLAAFGMGVAKFEQQQYEEALKWFQSAEEQRPGDLDARFNAVQCLLELRRLPAAKQLLQELIGDFPEDPALLRMQQQLASQPAMP